MQQLESEDAQLRKDDEQSKNERLAELNAKLSAISSSSDTSSTPPNAMPGESEM